MNFRYYLRAVLSLPLLPFMYRDGKRIFQSVPKLPDAAGPSGRANLGAGPVFRLLCVGESTMAGVGVATHAEGFAGTLARTLGEQMQREVAWRVYAKSGATARKLIEITLPRIEETEVDLIVVATGGNDGFKLTNPARFSRDVQEMIDWFGERFPGVSVAFTNIPPINDFPAFTPLIKQTIGRLVRFHGAELALLAQQDGVFYNADPITLEGWKKKHRVEGEPTDFFSDGVHPSRLTYQVWGRDFAAYLEANKIVGC